MSFSSNAQYQKDNKYAKIPQNVSKKTLNYGILSKMIQDIFLKENI